MARIVASGLSRRISTGPRQLVTGRAGEAGNWSCWRLGVCFPFKCLLLGGEGRKNVHLTPCLLWFRGVGNGNSAATRQNGHQHACANHALRKHGCIFKWCVTVELFWKLSGRAKRDKRSGLGGDARRGSNAGLVGNGGPGKAGSPSIGPVTADMTRGLEG